MSGAGAHGVADLAAVFAYIDRHREEFVDRLIEYVRRPSISAQGIGIEEVATYIADVMRSIGMESRLIQTEGSPMVLGQYHPRPEAPTVLVYGHYDVQPPDPIDAWISPPFEPTIREGRLYGRGVADNKGQHLAQILGFAALLACEPSALCNVTMLLEGEEEVGSPHMPRFVLEHRDQLRADLVVISDGPVHESGRSQILFGVRGVLSFELRAHGANRDLHSGNWGGIAPNPLWTLTHLLASMKNERGEVTIEGFYDHVQPLTESEHQALLQLPMDSNAVKRSLGIGEFDQPRERGLAERIMAWPTFTINGLHGGYGGLGSKTVLPCDAVAKCDMRLVSRQTAKDIFDRIVAHVQCHAPSIDVVWQGSMDPSKTPVKSPFTAVIRQGVVLGQRAEPLLVPTMGGSLPNYVFTRDLGLPTFVVPYANADEANHAPNENLELARFIGGIKTSAAILSSLGSQIR